MQFIAAENAPCGGENKPLSRHSSLPQNSGTFAGLL